MALTVQSAKILYVITDLEIGGVPLHLHRLACAMRLSGFHPTVVSLKEPGPVADRLRGDGIEVETCGGTGGWDLRVIGRLISIIERSQPDVMHSLLFHANIASRIAARLSAFPRDRVICEIQTVEVERRWHLTVDRWTHRQSRITVGNSPSVIRHLTEYARIPLDRLRLVWGGIDPAPYAAATPISRAALGLDESVPIVLWVGRLDPAKGLEYLLEAFRGVAASTKAHLLLAGGGRGRLHRQRGHLVRLITTHSLQTRVHLLGSRHDVPRLLKAADVFVFPSRTEGLPNALLEAMAAGCPIVTTDVPGCRDLISHMRTGLVVPYGDTHSLSTAMLRLLRDRKLAIELGSAAQDELSERWHIKGTFDAYRQLYAEALCP